MTLAQYEKALDIMGLSKDEQAQTEGMPTPVAYGFLIAQRRDHRAQRHSAQDWSAFGGRGLYGL